MPIIKSLEKPYAVLRRFRVAIAIGIICLSLTGGCASDLAYKRADERGDKAVIVHVPFVSQDPDYCGPAALAMIFNFWGMKITQGEIAKAIYSPELKGTLSLEMVLYAVQTGFEAEMYNGSFKDLKDKITSGFPLIVSHRAKKEKERVHYLVVFGFDDDGARLYVHSGAKQNLMMDYKTFLKLWSQADNLTLYIRPKNIHSGGAL